MRFLPTCSEYFIEALSAYGLIKGFRLGTRRILKCHPFKNLGGSHGVDFVPIPRNASRQERLKKIVEGLERAGWKLEDKKERKMDNKNVFVAIALSMSVLLFWGAFFETPRKPIDQKDNQNVEKKVEQSTIAPTISQPQIVKKLTREDSINNSKKN